MILFQHLSAVPMLQRALIRHTLHTRGCSTQVLCSLLCSVSCHHYWKSALGCRDSDVGVNPWINGLNGLCFQPTSTFLSLSLLATICSWRRGLRSGLYVDRRYVPYLLYVCTPLRIFQQGALCSATYYLIAAPRIFVRLDNNYEFNAVRSNYGCPVSFIIIISEYFFVIIHARVFRLQTV
jgi:hypothetical protein